MSSPLPLDVEKTLAVVAGTEELPPPYEKVDEAAREADAEPLLRYRSRGSARDGGGSRRSAAGSSRSSGCTVRDGHGVEPVTAGAAAGSRALDPALGSRGSRQQSRGDGGDGTERLVVDDNIQAGVCANIEVPGGGHHLGALQRACRCRLENGDELDKVRVDTQLGSGTDTKVEDVGPSTALHAEPEVSLEGCLAGDHGDGEGLAAKPVAVSNCQNSVGWDRGEEAVET